MKHLNLIFDFDGVIGDTKEAVIYGLIKSGRVADRASAIQNTINYSAKKPIHTKDHTLTNAELAEEYRWTASFGGFVHEHGFGLFDEFVSEIEKIETENKAIVSSGSQKYLLPAIAKTNINPTHVLAFENHHSKEEKIAIICQDWGVAVSEVYYFTDSLADVYELQNFISPDKLIGVNWGFCTKEQLLLELKEENILTTHEGIKEILGMKIA